MLISKHRWVVQELHFARFAMVHCGQEQVRWSSLAIALSVFMTKVSEVERLFGKDRFELGELQGLGATQLVAITNRYVCCGRFHDVAQETFEGL